MPGSLSVIIPAYNEEKRLPATLERVIAYIERSDWRPAEILVVDDGSTDKTVDVAERHRCASCALRILRNPGNRGKGYAVRHGMLEAQSAWILFSDADLSAPIEEIEKLRSAVEQRDASIAIGSRALDRSLIGVHESVLRENAGRIFNLLERVIVGLPFCDTQCGFKLFQASAGREIAKRQRLEGFGFDVEQLFIARKLGYRTIEVPVRWNHNAEGTRISMFRDSPGMFLDLLRIRWNQLRGRYNGRV